VITRPVLWSPRQADIIQFRDIHFNAHYVVKGVRRRLCINHFCLLFLYRKVLSLLFSMLMLLFHPCFLYCLFMVQQNMSVHQIHLRLSPARPLFPRPEWVPFGSMRCCPILRLPGIVQIRPGLSRQLAIVGLSFMSAAKQGSRRLAYRGDLHPRSAPVRSPGLLLAPLPHVLTPCFTP
jgi:hypothetical protein